MSLLSKKGLLARIRKSKASRKRLVESNLAKGIAYQIKATREKQKRSQADLAHEVGMTQNNFSRLESPDYGKQTLSSLKRIADALDVALVVRFVPFTQYIDWLSGTPFLDDGLRPGALAVPNFEEEANAKSFETSFTYWPVVTAAPEIGATSEPSVDAGGVYAFQTATAGAYELLGKAS